MTTEIYVSPPSGAFDWRVSIATVNADGPFSTFAGYERHIMTLSGEGMILDIEERGKFTLEPLRPFSFSGDAQVHGALSQGAVLDFNLMVRRDFGRGVLRVIDCGAGEILGSEKSLHLAYILQGKCEAEGHQLAPNSSFYLRMGEFIALPAPLKLAICEITPDLLPSPNA